MGAYEDAEVPILVRGEGCYVYDEHGKRYLDGLSALFCVNAGHGRAELGEAAAEQAKELGFYTNWSYAHPPAIELAARIAALAPGRPEPRLLHLRRLRGGRVRVEAVPRLPPDQRRRAAHQADRARDRLPRHHAGRALGHRDHRPAHAVRAAHAGRLPRAEHEQLPLAGGPRPAVGGRRDRGADPVRGPGDRGRRDPRAGPERRRLLRAAGGLLPARARDLRPVRRAADLRRGDLLVGPARPLLRRAALRLPAGHHHDGQGAHLGLRADGRGDRLRPGRRAVHGGQEACSRTASRSAAIRWPPRSRWPTSTSSSARTCCGHVRAKEGEFRAMLEGLRDIPIVGDVRGAGYFHAIELVKDQETKESFDDEESERLLRGFLSGALYEHGLICRADDRGDPVIQLSPPLIADTEQFEEIEAILRKVLTEARAPRRCAGAREQDAHAPHPRRRDGARAGERRRGRGRARCAGCTSPSCPTPRRGSRAAS